MTFNELCAEREKLAAQMQEIQQKLDNIDKKMSMAKQDQAEKLLQDIWDKIDEMKTLGYTIIVQTDDNPDGGLHWHEMEMSLHDIAITLI